MVGFVLAVAVVEEPAVLPAVPPTSDGLGEVNDSTPDVDCCSGSFCWAAEIVISWDQVKVKVMTVKRPIVQRMMRIVKKFIRLYYKTTTSSSSSSTQRRDFNDWTEGNREGRKKNKRKTHWKEFTNVTTHDVQLDVSGRGEFQTTKKWCQPNYLLAHFPVEQRRPDSMNQQVKQREEYLNNVTIGTNERRRLERLVWKCARLQVNFKVDWAMVSAPCVCWILRQRSRVSAVVGGKMFYPNERNVYNNSGEVCWTETSRPVSSPHRFDSSHNWQSSKRRALLCNGMLSSFSLFTRSLSLSHSFSPSYSQVAWTHR